MARCIQKKIVLPPTCMHPCAPPTCYPPCPPPCCLPTCCHPPCCPPSFPCVPSGPPCCPLKVCCGPKVPCCPCPAMNCKPMNLCNCCGGKSTIICVPKGCPPPGCSGPCYQPCCGPSPCCPQYCSPSCPPSCGPPCAEEKPASFNNCNFYCSELPNGVKVSGGNNNCCIEPVCMEEDPCCYDGMNRAAGDDQLAPAPRSGTSSSTPSSSRHGGTSSLKSSAMSSKKRFRGGGGKMSSNTESVEEYEDGSIQEGSSKTKSSTGKGSSTTPYSYAKSAMPHRTLHQQKVRNSQLSDLFPKAETKGHTTVKASPSAANQNDSCLPGKRYSTFAKCMSPVLNGASLAKGDVSKDKEGGCLGNMRHSRNETKFKLEDVTFPVRNNGHNDSQRSLCREIKNFKEKQDFMLGKKQPDGGESLNAIICKPFYSTNLTQLSVHPELATKSSEFSTNKIFGPSPPKSTSSSTICAPITNFTPLAQADTAHGDSDQFFRGSKSRIRHSKSADGLKKPLGKSAASLSISTVLDVNPDLERLVCRQGRFRSSLKISDDIHKKIVTAQQPICVMTCLIDRVNAKNEKKALNLSLSQSDEAKTFFDAEAASDLTGCTSGTDNASLVVNRNFINVGTKRCEEVTIATPSRTSSRITMRSFFSSGAVALPPSRRRWDLKTGQEFSASSADGHDGCDYDEKRKQPTILAPIPLSGDIPDSAKYVSMQVSSSDESSKTKRNLESNGGQTIILPQRARLQQKTPKLPSVPISFQMPAIRHRATQNEGSSLQDQKIRAHVTLSPIYPNLHASTDCHPEKATVNGQECQDSLKFRRKRRVRRIFTGENSWLVGDTALVGIPESLPYIVSIEKQ